MGSNPMLEDELVYTTVSERDNVPEFTTRTVYLLHNHVFLRVHGINKIEIDIFSLGLYFITRQFITTSTNMN